MCYSFPYIMGLDERDSQLRQGRIKRRGYG